MVREGRGHGHERAYSGAVFPKKPAFTAFLTFYCYSYLGNYLRLPLPPLQIIRVKFLLKVIKMRENFDAENG